jgi:hypothetical protein
LHIARLDDILKLAELRVYDCKGNRELMCFLTRYYAYITTGDKEKAKETMIDLNNMFIEPLKEYKLIVDTKSAERAVEKYLLNKDKGYNYSNERLIEILNIELEEQKYLKTIISKSEANEREKKSKKLKRRNEKGLTNREQEKQEKLKLIMELKAQGLKQSEIAQKLEISKGLVSIYLKSKKV